MSLLINSFLAGQDICEAVNCVLCPVQMPEENSPHKRQVCICIQTCLWGSYCRGKTTSQLVLMIKLNYKTLHLPLSFLYFKNFLSTN